MVEKELGKSISQSYLSQIESGTRPHLTNSTRMLLARFFKVHPGYLVDDPEGFSNELISDLGAVEDKLDLWLICGAERFCRDVDLHHALLTAAKHKDSRMCLILLGTILENPGLAERLIEVLKAPPSTPAPKVEEAIMTWSTFYLICFLVGFGMSALSLLSGSVHLHLPHLHFDHGIHLGHGHGGGSMAARPGSTSAPWRRFWRGSAAPAICWSTTTASGSWWRSAMATLSGLGGASVVFWFLAKVLMSREEALDPADYDMVGVLGKLSMPIRAGGTGELIYTQGGTRRVSGARAESGAAIAKGTEVVVTRYEKGIAYVRAWDELAGDVEQKA